MGQWANGLRAVRTKAGKTTTMQDPQVKTDHIENHMLADDGKRDLTSEAPGARVACHVRAAHKYSQVLDLDHYLEVLTRKPGAVAGATALDAARASGAFTRAHQRFWDKARTSCGDKAGTRALIEVLLLSRTLGPVQITEAMVHAVATGDFDTDRLAVRARTAGAIAPLPAVLASEVIGRIGHLPEREHPSLAGYDVLLAGVGGGAR